MTKERRSWYDPALFGDVKGWPPKDMTTWGEIAIGEMRTTDVLTCVSRLAHLPGGFVPFSVALFPAGLAAY